MIRSLQVTDAEPRRARADDRRRAPRSRRRRAAREGARSTARRSRPSSTPRRWPRSPSATSCTDNVNTIGQIFTNYQAALHQFEEAVGRRRRRGRPARAGQGGPARGRARRASSRCSRPRPRRPARSATTSPRAWASTDVRPAEQPRQPGASAPAYALHNLVVAERRRIAAHADAAAQGAGRRSAQPARRAPARAAARYRERLLGANMDLNEMEETSHSADGIFKTLMERYKEAAKGRTEVRDRDRPATGASCARTSPRRAARKLAGPAAAGAQRLVRPQRPAPRAPRHLGAGGARRLRGAARRPGRAAALRPQREGRRATSTSSRSGCARDGLPHTRVLTGD